MQKIDLSGVFINVNQLLVEDEVDRKIGDLKMMKSNKWKDRTAPERILEKTRSLLES